MSPATKQGPLGLRALARRFGQDQGGASAVEFTLLVPVLFAAFVASLEVSNLIWTRTSTSEAASAVADITTRFVSVDDATVLSAFQASERIINSEARAVAGLTMRLTSVLACEDPAGSGDYTFRVIWSHGFSDGGLTAGHGRGDLIADIPQVMGPPSGGTLVYSEADYQYTLPFGFVLNAGVNNFNAEAYFRPRLSRSVAHTGSQAANQAPTCP